MKKIHKNIHKLNNIKKNRVLIISILSLKYINCDKMTLKCLKQVLLKLIHRMLKWNFTYERM